MKNVTAVLIFTLLFVLNFSQAQTLFDKKYFKYNHYIDLNFSSNFEVYNINKTWYRLHTINENKRRKKSGSLFNSNRFHLGYGARGGAMFGNDMQIPTYNNKNEKIDINMGETIYANAGIYGLLDFSPNVAFGFNSDIIGFSVGAQRYARFNDDNNKPSALADIEVSPSNFNLIAHSGTINSNFFFLFWFTEKLYLKVGYNLLSTEYQYRNLINPDLNRDFYNHTHLPMVSLGYCGARVDIFRR